MGAIANLSETGMPNLSPARIDLIGDKAGFVHHDYFQQLSLDVTDGPVTEDLSLAAIETYHVLLKRRPSDADADAIGSGSVTNTADEATGQVTVHFPRAILDLADQGLLWWTFSGTTTTGSYVVPLAEGRFELRQSSLTEVAS
jgi:hypothetical protein